MNLARKTLKINHHYSLLLLLAILSEFFFSGHEEIYETKLFTFPVQVFLFSDENQENEISTFSRLFLFTYLVTLIWIELNFKASARKSAKLSSKLTPKFNLQHPEKWKWKLIEFVWLQLKIIAPGSSIHRLFQHAWTHKLLTGRQWQIFVWTRKTWQTVDAYKLTGFAHNSSFSFNIESPPDVDQVLIEQCGNSNYAIKFTQDFPQLSCWKFHWTSKFRYLRIARKRTTSNEKGKFLKSHNFHNSTLIQFMKYACSYLNFSASLTQLIFTLWNLT